MSVRYLLILSAKAHGESIQLLEILIIEQINVEPRRCHMHLQKKKTRNLGEADKPDRKVTSAQIDPG
jgi:hypothetical protein